MEPGTQFTEYYHGTTEKAARKIAKKGFDTENHAGSANGTSAGRGVYLTNNPRKAAEFGPVVLRVGVPDHLDIHPQPYRDQDIFERQMATMQSVRDLANRGGTDPDPEYTERVARKIADHQFSDHVAAEGYQGHADPDDRGTIVIHQGRNAHFLGRLPQRGKKA